MKHLDNEALPFEYETTGEKTWFMDYRDPKPRVREVFDADPDGDGVGQDVTGVTFIYRLLKTKTNIRTSTEMKMEKESRE